MTTLARLGFQIETDPMRRATREMRGMSQEANRTGRNVRGTSNRVKELTRSTQGASQQFNRFTGAIKAAAGALALVGTARQIRSTIESTAQISELADVAGISAEKLQELTKAFSDMAGISEGITQGALRRFNRRLGLADQGTGAAAKTFGELNIELRGIDGSMRATESVLDDAISRLAEFESASERAAFASRLFGDDAGPRLSAAIGQGGEALRRHIQLLREQGRVMSDEAVAAAREANDELSRMSSILSTQMASRIAENSDAILSVAQALFKVGEGAVWALDKFVRFGEGIGETAGRWVHGPIEDLQELDRQIEQSEGRLQVMLEAWNNPTLIGRLFSRDDLAGRIGDLRDELDDLIDRRDALASMQQQTATASRTTRTLADDFDALDSAIPSFADAALDVRTLADELAELDAIVQARSFELAADGVESIRDQLDPTRAELREFRRQVELLDSAVAHGILSPDGRQDLARQLADNLSDAATSVRTLSHEFAALEDAANGVGESTGDEFTRGFERSAQRIASSLEQAIMSGDWSGMGNAIGGAIAGQVTEHVGSALAAQMGGGAAAAFAGPIGGAVAGGLVGSMLSGGSTSTTQRTELGIDGDDIFGQTITSLKRRGLLGSSTRRFSQAISDATVSMIENSFERSTDSVNRAARSLGIDTQDALRGFSVRVRDAGKDYGRFVNEATDEYVRSIFAASEDYRRANESLIDVIERLASDAERVTRSFQLTVGDIGFDAFDMAVQTMAGEITDGLERQAEEARRRAVRIRDAMRFVAEHGASQGMTFSERERTLENLGRQLENQISEISNIQARIATATADATAQFTTSMAEAIERISGVDDGSARLIQLSERYEDVFVSQEEAMQRRISEARESLSRFDDLGVDASTSLDSFRRSFEEFSESESFSPESFARWLEAANALADLNDAADGLADVVQNELAGIRSARQMLAGPREDELARLDAVDLLRASLQTGDFTGTGDAARTAAGIDAGQFVSSQEFDRARAFTLSLLDQVEAAAVDQHSIEERQLSTMEQQLQESRDQHSSEMGALSSINQNLGGTASMPAFASGGSHSGGIRLVGERGPEIEATGPSRITSNQDLRSMLSMDEVVRAVNDLRARLDRIAGYGYETAKSTRRTRRVMDQWDRVGVPQGEDLTQ